MQQDLKFIRIRERFIAARIKFFGMAGVDYSPTFIVGGDQSEPSLTSALLAAICSMWRS
jgi:hypothetical protein